MGDGPAVRHPRSGKPRRGPVVVGEAEWAVRACCHHDGVTITGRLPAALAATALLAGCTSGVSSEPLVQRESVRGHEVLVPADWIVSSSDGGGSGSATTWADPRDPARWIRVVDGVEAGAWCATDGVPGSIDPTALLPESASLVRRGRGVVEFTFPGADRAIAGTPPSDLVAPGTVRGIWVGSPSCDGYLSLSYALPGWSDESVQRVVDSFLASARAASGGP